ncbi:NAD(P)-binding protein [Zopfia rhizophila CBS 207.26]|uniref:NAD(P)-binding protein n=1 Tax=Zopfia rhizophila CBS 207.26 TaxID=1314779 RepID=A0A6A6DMP8_9PEZI|nr:NAD(P)-binding protein [Zopfia rhizophila CBS 207.26]
MPPSNKIRDLFNVNQLVAVVTGGGSGLGLYAARALDANGAKAVYIVGRRENILKEAAKTATNGTIIPIVGDVTDKDSLAKVADQVRREQGYINLLLANAGVPGPRPDEHLSNDANSKPTIKEFQDACWEPGMDFFTSALNVNCTAVFYTTIAFLDLLDAGNKKRNVPQDSQILVTSSAAGFICSLNVGFAYSASKAGVTFLVKMLSTYFAQNKYHIRANVIAPGLYPSDMTTSATSNLNRFNVGLGYEGVFPDALAVPPQVCPAERSGSAQDFAATVIFMTSQAGAYLNGEVLVTDGGLLGVEPGAY